MFSNFIKTSVLAAALALGGTAVAGDTGNNGNMQNGTQPQQTQGVNDQTQGQSQGAMQGQQGMTNQAVKSVRLSALDQTQLKDVQTQLKDLGFYKGNIDGVLGNQTKGALSAFFQQQLSLAGQGRISDQALSGFGFQKSDIEKVRGVDESSGNVRQNTNGQESPQINDQNKNQNTQPQQTQPQTQPKQTQPVQPQQQNEPQQPQRQPY